jgi:poly-gamma-glutamate synthesis protein (capsule biosynthesis protein)
MNFFRLPALLVSLGLLVSACAAPAAALPPTATTPPPTLRPTATPRPATITPTWTPSATASPTITPTPSPTEPPDISLLFTGVIVPARCVQAGIDASGDPNYPYDEVRSIIQDADLAVGTLNATVSDFPPHTGCVFTYVLVGSANNADAMQAAGFDVMSVATNHIKNCGITTCGDRAFFDTLANLKRVGIAAVGAGRNHAEAMQPVVVTVKGVRFGFVSLGQIEPMAFAGEDTPGIAILNPENLDLAIAAARKVSDVVIVMPHWGPEDVPNPNWSQKTLAQHAVDAGADLVMGNHTHVVQAIDTIDGVPVFYGLGNFVFDQGLRDHRQGVILIVHFTGTQFSRFELIPTHTDANGLVHVADPTEAAEIQARIDLASDLLH